ncbi:MAG: FHA domain-containing protein [Gammaproteobacteria bacterium]|nr:FHA domain-containing protein [Gammaproteobacteria bacterium]
MEALILEIKTAGLHSYHELEKDQIRVGRALDNDIILSDPTVAPHHLRITRLEDGQIHLENLSTVNPSHFKGKADASFHHDQLPIDFKLGRITAAILPRDHVVEDTRSLAGNGHSFHLFGNLIWAILLPLACLLVGAMEFYLDSYKVIKWDALFAYVLRETALGLAAYIVGLSIIERLLVNRWEIKLVTTCACLVYLLYVLAAALISQVSYFYSSHWPLILFDTGWMLFLIPTAISLYLIHISHLKSGRSVLLAIFISSPFSLPAIMDDSMLKYLIDDFSTAADYHKALAPLNWHLSETVPIDKFIQQAKQLDSGQFVD